MNLGQKIQLLRKESGLTQKELGKKACVSEKTIIRYEANDAQVTVSIVEKLANALNTPLSYFMSDTKYSVRTDLVKLDYYPNISVSAGYGAINYDETSKTVEMSSSFLEALGVKALKNLDLVSVFGDSMEPFVSNGEMIIVERTHEAKNNDIVIANVNGEVYVKKLQRSPFGNTVKLISTNQMYMDIELKDDELEYLTIVGVVRAKIRPF